MIKSQCFFQILILVIGIIAFAYSFNLVSGAVPTNQEKIAERKARIKEIESLFGKTKLSVEDQNKLFAEIDKINKEINRLENPSGGDNPSGAPNPGSTGGREVTTSIFKASEINVDKFKFGSDKVVSITSSIDENKIISYKGTTIDGREISISTEQLRERGLIDATGNLKTAETGSLVGDWLLKKGWMGEASANAVGHIVSGVGWAMTVGGVIKFFGGFLTDNQVAVDAVAMSLSMGTLAGKTTYGLIKEGGWLHETNAWIGEHAGAVSIGAGAAVAILIFALTYKQEEIEIIQFNCLPWEAPAKGSDCEKCNQQGDLPCSIYQCKALGQACELLNQEDEKEAKCVWVNRNDVNPPVIEPWEDALLQDFKYEPDKTISPPDRGVKIIYKSSTDGCAPAFTPLSFGITTDEPAKCKLDYLRKQSFDEMAYYFGGSSLFKEGHTQVMSLPGPSALTSENITLQNGGQFELYTRCQDANKNANVATFVFKFCIDEGPDTTPPLIVTTNLLNNMPVAFEQKEIDLNVYTNEPADCKWTHETDKSYDKMENSMSCSSSVLEINAQMLYKCSTTLIGLKDRQENKFYFRCKDKAGNINSEGYLFNLIGTQPLIITEVEPNGTIKDSTEVIKVTLEAKTSAGYKEGEANCYYSDTGDEGSYIMFFNTNSYKHSQDLYLPEGDYKYYIKCIDLGGNADTDVVNFEVESDSSAPIITRAYHEGTHLKIITNENAECVYSTESCNYLFDDGISMVVVNGNEHFTDWKTDNNFYIKCKDEYNNQPLPNQCSIIARPFELYGE